MDLLTELKAELEVARARALLESLTKTDGSARVPDRAEQSRRDHGRELEVLRLVAAGSTTRPLASASSSAITRSIATWPTCSAS